MDAFAYRTHDALEVVTASLGSDSALLGAAELAFRGLLADPALAGALGPPA